MSIPAPFIQELLSRVDVVDVVGRHVELKKSGANYMGLCPFHGEKSPSFSVSPAKQFYHCFGCGKNGDAIRFLTEHSGMSFIEAVQTLAQGAGLSVPQDDTPAHERQRSAAIRQKQQTLTEVLERAGDAWRQHLKNTPHAIDYLKRRGVSGAIASHYGLGYAPEGWRTLAGVFPEYDSPLLQESGLVIVNPEDDKRYDRFRERIMFPIRNVKGECIGYGGRVLGDEKPKYLNSPETPVFHKGHELYGLFEARQAIREQGYALVTEGYMDVVALAQLGFGNAVATLGTACTDEHVHKLFRFTEHIVFSFDGDGAGRRAARKALDAALPYASDTRSIKFLFLPAEHDPDSFIRNYGPDAFARHVGDAMPLSRFVQEAAREGCDLGLPEGRAHMLSNAQTLWQALPKGVLQRQLLQELADLGQLPAHELGAIWAQNAPGQRSAGAAAPNATPGAAGMPGAAAKPWGEARTGRGKYPKKHNFDSYQRPPVMPLSTMTARIDHAARLLLSHMPFLEELTPEDHALLGQHAAPHGPLFIWLEQVFHTQGAQPWAILREQLQGQAVQALADRLMTGSHAQTEGEESELRAELRDMLDRMLIEALKQQQNHLIARAAQDPEALAQYRQLQQRRHALEQGLAPGQT